MRAVLKRTGTRMMGTVSWLPIVLSPFTAVGFLAGPDSQDASQRLGAVLFGAAVGTLAWLTAAVAANELVLPERANRRSYFDLRSRFATLEADLNRLSAAPDAAALRVRLLTLANELSSTSVGPGWSSGEAYVVIWRGLHRLEEELIEFETPGQLPATLSHDELRVEDSRLNRKESAVRAKIDEAKRQLQTAGQGDVRPLLKEIRYAVNDFRDAGFDTLVRARGTTERLSGLLGLTMWVLLCIAILMSASRMDIALVSALYLVGVTAGLITRLRSRRSGEAREDVYGYGQANELQIVLLSGLAGIAGVLLSWAGAAGSAGADMATAGISATMTATPAVFLTAAVSGLAPGVLFDRLDDLAKTSLKDLSSTLPGQGEPA